MRGERLPNNIRAKDTKGPKIYDNLTDTNTKYLNILQKSIRKSDYYSGGKDYLNKKLNTLINLYERSRVRNKI